ncbi:MAG: CPBP family intramembrane metalloprotease [Acidimicrobiia bacterium]|nr:CPBP family intramembrane metalloprotease [Acidimicrobiia bacterium]
MLGSRMLADEWRSCRWRVGRWRAVVETVGGRSGVWTAEELRSVRRPSAWLTPPPRPVQGPPTAEAAVVAGVTALHVVDHAAVPSGLQPGLHLAVAAAAVGAALGAGATIDELGLAPDRAGAGLRHGAVTGALITGAVTGAALVPATRPLFNDVRLATASTVTVVSTATLRIPLGTALYEEIVFRGVLMGLALRRTSPLGALGLTSVAFGLWHVLPTLADHAHHPLTKDRARLTSVVGAVANTTVAGVGFGSARLRSGSVVAPILAHTASNVAAYLAAAVVTRRRYGPARGGVPAGGGAGGDSGAYDRGGGADAVGGGGGGGGGGPNGILNASGGNRET